MIRVFQCFSVQSVLQSKTGKHQNPCFYEYFIAKACWYFVFWISLQDFYDRKDRKECVHFDEKVVFYRFGGSRDRTRLGTPKSMGLRCIQTHPRCIERTFRCFGTTTVFKDRPGMRIPSRFYRSRCQLKRWKNEKDVKIRVFNVRIKGRSKSGTCFRCNVLRPFNDFVWCS